MSSRVEPKPSALGVSATSAAATSKERPSTSEKIGAVYAATDFMTLYGVATRGFCRAAYVDPPPRPPGAKPPGETLITPLYLELETKRESIQGRSSTVITVLPLTPAAGSAASAIADPSSGSATPISPVKVPVSVPTPRDSTTSTGAIPMTPGDLESPFGYSPGAKGSFASTPAPVAASS